MNQMQQSQLEGSKGGESSNLTCSTEKYTWPCPQLCFKVPRQFDLYRNHTRKTFSAWDSRTYSKIVFFHVYISKSCPVSAIPALGYLGQNHYVNPIHQGFPNSVKGWENSPLGGGEGWVVKTITLTQFIRVFQIALMGGRIPPAVGRGGLMENFAGGIFFRVVGTCWEVILTIRSFFKAKNIR